MRINFTVGLVDDELEERGTVEGYLNIPIEELADRLEEVPRDRPILTA